MNAHALLKFAIAGLLASSVAACSGSDGQASDAQSAAASVAANGSEAVARSACNLLSEAEVAALAGEPVRAERGRTETTVSGCSWFGVADSRPYLDVTITWSGGRDAWETRQAGTAQAREMIRKSERVDIDSVVKPGPVAGLGDAAVYADLLPAAILNGDTLIEVMAFYLPNARRKFRGLGELLLQRVGQ